MAAGIAQRFYRPVRGFGTVVRHAGQVTALTLWMFTPIPAQAQTAPELPTPATIGSLIPLEQATDLNAQPLALLAKFPEAGVRMVSYVAQIIAKQPSLVDAVLSIVSDASPEQASAIGAGLVRGVRAMRSKAPQNALSLTEKIMNSNNRWLKTTFTALGPRYAPGSFVAPAILPPLAPASASVGEPLAASHGRVGPNPNTPPDPLRLPGAQATKKQNENLNKPYSGTAVAILISDAPANGVVSTSPTF